MSLFISTPAHKAAVRRNILRAQAANRGKPAHNRGMTKSELGNSHAWVDRVCETCGTLFKAQVRRIARGGGRFCSKRCNPAYAPQELPYTKYRRYNLRANYGMTVEQYNELAERQGGVCAICGDAPRGNGGSSNSLHVDHCHRTGVVRALLCASCNRALGWFRDSTTIMRSAISYLEAHS